MLTLTESDVEKACDELARTLGWEVENYSQRRQSKVHEGLPDRRYVHPGLSLRIWVESKKPGGQMTAGQHKWIKDELDAGGLAVPIDDVMTLLPLFRGLMRGGLHAGEVKRRCEEITALVAARGYRGMRKSDGLPKGSPRAGWPVGKRKPRR